MQISDANSRDRRHSPKPLLHAAIAALKLIVFATQPADVSSETADSHRPPLSQALIAALLGFEVTREKKRINFAS